MVANEAAELLKGLLSQYRDRHAGKDPDRVYVSVDIFTALQDQNAVKKMGDAFVFDGVAVEPKSGQSLPFLLRP